MKTFFYQHRVALVTAVIVGVLTVLPSFIAPLQVHGGYQGVLFAPLDDEDLYRAIIHEVLDGHWMAAVPFVYEGKHAAHVLVPPFTLWMYASLAIVIGLSGAIVFAKFLFPALLFFLVYYLTLLLVEKTGERQDATLTAISAGLLVTFGYEFINYRHLIPVLLGNIPPVPPVWTRPVNPVVGVIEAFAFLVLVYKMWTEHISWKYIAGAAALLALSASYYFSFGISLAVLGSLGLIALARKEFSVVRALLYVVGISLVLDAWYWWSAISLNKNPAIAMRNGMFFTHEPHFNLLLFAATVFVAICYGVYLWQKRCEHTREWLFIWVLLASSWLAFNEQVITGREIWYFHFVQFTIPFSMVAGLAAAHTSLRPLLPRLWRLGIYLLCAVCLAYGFFTLTSYRSSADVFARQQSYAPLFSWLAQNAEKDCVVFVTHTQNDSELQRLVPAYTPCNVYATPAAEFVEDRQRIQDNFFLNLKIAGIQPSQLASYLDAHEEKIRGQFFDDWSQLHPQRFDEKYVVWLSATKARLMTAYPAFYATNAKVELLKYRFDYLVSEGHLPASVIALFPGLKQIDEAGGFYVYSF